MFIYFSLHVKDYTLVRSKKCHQNIDLYKTMISLNMFQYKKLDTLNYVYEVLCART